MRLTQSATYALGAAVVVLVAGCSSGSTGSQFAPADGPQASSGEVRAYNLLKMTSVVPRKTLSLTPSKVVDRQHAIKPNCCAHTKTAFVSDSGGRYSSYSASVQMFDYTSGAYLGSVVPPPEGFAEPQGLCSDRQGNVYVTNTDDLAIDVYSHSGTYIRTMNDPYGYPVACSVNKKTGDVAVSNVINQTAGFPGNLAVFKHGKGKPTEYSTGLLFDGFVGYVANSSTVWMSGYANYSSKSVSAVASIDTANGNQTLIHISGANFRQASTVTYSGNTKTMVVGDSDTNTFYQVNPTTYKVTGSTSLECTDICSYVQGTVKGQGLLAADSQNATAGIYPFPAGGAPVVILTGGSFHQPIGTAISPDVPQ